VVREINRADEGFRYAVLDRRSALVRHSIAGWEEVHQHQPHDPSPHEQQQVLYRRAPMCAPVVIRPYTEIVITGAHQ